MIARGADDWAYFCCPALPKGVQGKKVANLSIPERLSKSSALSPDIAPGLEAVAQLFIRLCAEAAAS